MIKTKIAIILIVVLFFSAGVLLAKTDVPPWMENVDVSGRSNYLVPKGAKRKVVGSQIIVEPPNEYVARRLYELDAYLEKRFTAIEETQKEILEKLETLKSAAEDWDENNVSNQEIQSLKDSVVVLEEFKTAVEPMLEERERQENVNENITQGVIGPAETAVPSVESSVVVIE